MFKRFVLVMIILVMAGTTYAQTAVPVPYSFQSQAHPVDTLAAYYNAINRGEYQRAYSYWNGSAPGGATLAQFTQGFADTRSIQALVWLPLYVGVAAGSSYASVPVILIATRTNGTQQIYAGCFTSRKANIPAGTATQPDPNWYLYSAKLNPVNTVDFSLAIVDQCAEVEAFPLAAPFTLTTHPIDTLTAYYDAIARTDFARAYGYWGGHNTSQTLQAFSNGFAGTSNIGVVVDLDMLTEGAAGSIYAEIPVLLTATSNNVSQWFAGCYIFRKSNVPTGTATQPDPNWYLYTVQNQAANNLQGAVALVGQACDATGG